MEKICVQGMCAVADRIISEESEKCAGCKVETERCVKLYRRTGSLDTCCVELT